MGPDPWDYVNNVNTMKIEENVPPDLKTLPSKKPQTNNIGAGEWFYKRILAIVLKGGQIKKNEDGSIDVALQMNYSPEKWSTLEDYIKSNTPLSEDMFRRSMGYVEDAIYKPTITQKIAMAWSEYIQYYLIEYKMQITWATSIIAGVLTIFWLWKHLSHKHVIMFMILGLYLYEVFISYKEAEKQELDKFLTAVNSCKWYIWSSNCEVPPPDPLIFLKHMNPLKIGIRMFTTLLSEPMITINETIKTILHGVTDGLWFPFDKLILNFLGMINIGLKQRKRSIHNIISEPSQGSRLDNGDRISGENLTKFLDVYTKALNTVQSAQSAISERWQPNSKLSITCKPKMKKSASTGRLPTYTDSNECLTNNGRVNCNGGGDTG
ncbi:unnamed protein product, partial [Brenthis ino]